MMDSLKGKSHIAILSACAPIVDNPEEVKDMIYEEPDALIASVP